MKTGIRFKISQTKKNSKQYFEEKSFFSDPQLHGDTSINREFNPTKKSLESCPEEILIKIIANLSTHELLTNVARISKRFCALTQLQMTHICVTLPDYADQRQVSKFLTENKKTEVLKIKGKKMSPSYVELKGFDVQLLRPITEHKSLKVLNVHSLKCFNENNLIFLLKSSNAKSLEKIRVENYHNISGHKNRSDWSSQASNLKHLELCYYPSNYFNNARFLSANTLIKIGQAANKLEYLKFDGDIFDEEKIGTIFKENQNTLKEVHLPFNICSEEDLLLLVQCCQLESLSLKLSFTDVSKETFLKVPENKHLKKLSLFLFFCINSEIEHFFSHPNLSELTSLKLESSKVASDEILKAISSCKHLSYLKLVQCYDIKASYHSLFHVLRKCDRLETLILDIWIEFDVEYFERIFKMNLPNLKYLKMECWEFEMDFQLNCWGLQVSFPTDFVITTCLQHSKNIKAVFLGPTIYCKPEGRRSFEVFIGTERKHSRWLFNQFPCLPKVYSYFDLFKVLNSQRAAMSELGDIDGFLRLPINRDTPEVSPYSTLNIIKKFIINQISALL